jgi:hypothetical protein
MCVEDVKLCSFLDSTRLSRYVAVSFYLDSSFYFDLYDPDFHRDRVYRDPFGASSSSRRKIVTSHNNPRPQ